MAAYCDVSDVSDDEDTGFPLAVAAHVTYTSALMMLSAAAAATTPRRKRKTARAETVTKILYNTYIPYWRAVGDTASFRQRFRLTEELVDNILLPRLATHPYYQWSPSAHGLNLKQHLLVALARLANPTEVHKLSWEHGVSKGVASGSTRMWQAIVDTMMEEFVQDLAPLSAATAAEATASCAALQLEGVSLHNCAGMMDGTHFEIRTEFPGTDMQHYKNRKGYMSVNIQVRYQSTWKHAES
jgi:hypothetical protein